MFITGYDVDGVSRNCTYNSEDYCDNHPVHVLTENFILTGHRNFEEFTEIFQTLQTPVEDNLNVSLFNETLNEENLDLILSGQFKEQTQRMRLLSVVSSNIETVNKLKTTREVLQSNMESGVINLDTYFDVLNKVYATFTPMKKTMLSNIEALKTMSSNKEVYFYFPIDTSELPESDEMETLKNKTGDKRNVIPLRRSGKHLQVLSETPAPEELLSRMLRNKTYDKFLRKTGLDQCVVNIHLILNNKTVETETNMQGWATLTKQEERYIKLVYETQMEPLKERFESIVDEMNRWEIMMSKYFI
jgi:hypothetical protein